MEPHVNHVHRIPWRTLGPVLLVLALPFLLGAWKLSTGPKINPNLVQRIEDGKTKKHEILTWFGDPQDTERLPEGEIYIYKTYRPKSELPRVKREEPKMVMPTVDSPYTLEREILQKKTSNKTLPSQELDSTLVIRFKPDGETVQSHDYKQY
uniref:Uncharacterized protein n=1 Tax=Desulfobacca acetoxidans TaxID=60893 RepID=A0A7C3Z1Q4_9BACT